MIISNRSLYDAYVTNSYNSVFAASRDCFANAKSSLSGGLSHTTRNTTVFPPFARSAKGAIVHTVDGIPLLDYFQGHFSNLLGHNPPVALEALEKAILEDQCLQLGLSTMQEYDLAELLAGIMNLEHLRFTTSGSLATMYAVMIAIAYTGRATIVKVAGGWHGANPYLLKSVNYPNGVSVEDADSLGVPHELLSNIVTINYNDTCALNDAFKKHGTQIAAFIVEPVLGSCGMTLVDREFLQEARHLTHKYGSLLIIDEIISFLRVHPGLLCSLYRIEPDIVTIAKIAGGGMPLACFAGKREVMNYASRTHPRVLADGGTYSAHPATLAVAFNYINYLINHSDTIYPHMMKMTRLLKHGLETIIAKYNIPAVITGKGNTIVPDFPIGSVRYYHSHQHYDTAVLNGSALEHIDDQIVDIDFRNRISRIAMMLKGIYTWQGLGCVTQAHTERDIYYTLEKYAEYASEIEYIWK